MLPRESPRSETGEMTKGIKKSRRWTASQIDRKRQLDRESQRILREKTKNRISHLEDLVKCLQANDDERAQKLYRQIDQQQAEIQRLQGVIRGITRIIEGANSVTSPPSEQPKETLNQNSSTQITPPPEPYEVTSPPAHQLSEQSQTSTALDESVLWPEADSVMFDNAYPILDSPSQPVSAPDLTIPQLAASIADDVQLDGRLWYLAGGILAHLLKNPKVDLPTTTEFDQDIAIRAVFEGWPAVYARYQLDSCWQWLKELDERVYYGLPKVDRLMHMRNVRLVFLKQVYRSSEWDSQIPTFFQARPAERHITHDPLIEHFPWPAFRERLLYAPLKFATNKFMDALRTQVDFIWNHSERDLYRKENVTGLYTYSNELLHRLRDLRCYTVKRGFFEQFPELRADIPCSATPIRDLFPSWSSPSQSSITTTGEDDSDEDIARRTSV